MTESKRLITIFNDVIQVCHAARQGYDSAAAHVESPDLQKRLTTFAAQRAKFITELEQTVVALGGKPHNGDNLLARLHRGWMDIKAARTQHGDDGVLAECERGEQYAMQHYMDAMAANLPDSQHYQLLAQYKQIKAAYTELHTLRKSLVEVPG